MAQTRAQRLKFLDYRLWAFPFGLVLLFFGTVYLCAWSGLYLLIETGHWHKPVLGVDVVSAFERASSFFIVRLLMAGVLAPLGLILCAFRKPAGLVAFSLATLAHISLWVQLATGLYYQGQFGAVFVFIEILGLVMIGAILLVTEDTPRLKRTSRIPSRPGQGR